MKEKGWIIGSGLGKSSTGISEPLVAEGQRPHCKSGLGYILYTLDYCVCLCVCVCAGIVGKKLVITDLL